MNWRRGLFRLWIVGSALFVIAVAYVSYSDIKREFNAVARMKFLCDADRCIECNACVTDSSFARERPQSNRKSFSATPTLMGSGSLEGECSCSRPAIRLDCSP
jgi:Fe-S-cluster-containing dehydrogenase component